MWSRYKTWVFPLEHLKEGWLCNALQWKRDSADRPGHLLQWIQKGRKSSFRGCFTNSQKYQTFHFLSSSIAFLPVWLWRLTGTGNLASYWRCLLSAASQANMAWMKILKIAWAALCKRGWKGKCAKRGTWEASWTLMVILVLVGTWSVCRRGRASALGREKRWSNAWKLKSWQTEKDKKLCKTQVEEFEEVTTGEQRTVVTQLLNHKVYTLPIHSDVLNLLAF